MSATRSLALSISSVVQLPAASLTRITQRPTQYLSADFLGYVGHFFDVGGMQELHRPFLLVVYLLGMSQAPKLTSVDRQNGLGDHTRPFGVERSAGVVEAPRSAANRLKHNANARLALEGLMLDLAT